MLTRAVSFNIGEFIRLKGARLSTVFLSLVGIFSLQQMSQIYTIFQDSVKLPEPFQSKLVELKEAMEGMVKLLVSSSSIPELLWVILIVAVIPAVSEEVLFRGLIQRTLEKSIRPLWSAVLTGVIFGVFHINPFSFLPLVLIGIYLGFVALRADSILVPILAHFFNNLMACIAAYLNVEDDYIVGRQAGNASFGSLILIFLIFGAIFALSTYYLVRFTRPYKKAPDEGNPIYP